jgi:hypothetical protein
VQNSSELRAIDDRNETMDWNEPEFKRFVELIEKFWPTHKVTEHSVRGLWHKSFKNRPAEEVEHALFRHRGEHPDATKPLWKLVLADLGLLTEAGINEFDLLIKAHREHGRDSERSDAYPSGRPLTDKSNADVWASWLRANSPRCTMSRDVGHELCENAVCVKTGGCGLTRRECSGLHWEANETAMWIKYLEGKGHPVPVYLSEPELSQAEQRP